MAKLTYSRFMLTKIVDRKENIMGFVVKDTITKLDGSKTITYFFGSDGYVHDEVSEPKPYTKKGYAMNYIKRNVNQGWRFQKVDEFSCIEGGTWQHTYEIVEVE